MLNPSLDEIFLINDFKVGKTFKAIQSVIVPVGKAVSFALSASKFLQDNLIEIIGFVGKNEISSYTTSLTSNNLKHYFFPLKGETRSNKTIIDLKNNTTTHIRTQGFKLRAEELDELSKYLISKINSKDILVITGSIPNGVPKTFYKKLIKMVKTKDVTTVLDSSGESLIEAVKVGPTIIKPNIHELAEILNDSTLNNICFQNGLDNIKDIALKSRFLLSKYDIEVILITLGSKGAILLTKEKTIYGVVALNKTISTVGCGDAFLGAFISQYIFNKPLKTCFKLALACGAANTLKIEPGLFDKDVALNLQKRVKTRYLD